MSEWPIGSRVRIRGSGAEGTVAYVGNLEGKSGIFHGISLDRPAGRNDGSVAGVSYFRCEQSHGLFVRSDHLSPALNDDAEPVPHVPRNARGAPGIRSAARSHEQNSRYMDEFHTAYAELAGERHSSPCTSNLAEASNGTVSATDFMSPALGASQLSEIQMARGWSEGPRAPAGTLCDASDAPILCSALSPDESEVALGGADHGLRIFSLRTGRETRNLYTKRFGHSEWVTCVAYTPEGEVLSGGMDRKLCLWDSCGVRCVDLEGHSHSVSSIAVTNSGCHAVSGSYDKTLRVWGLTGRERGKELCALKGHKAPVLELGFVGGLLCSGARDGVAMLWDLGAPPGRGASCKLPGHNGHVTALCCGGNEEGKPIFATGDQAGWVRVWDSRSGGQPVMKCNAHPGGAVNGLEAHAGGAMCGGVHPGTLVSAGADCRILALEPRRGLEPLRSFGGHKDFIYSLKLAGHTVLSGAGDGMLLVHDVRSGQLLYGLGANQAGVRCIESTNEHLIAAGDDGKAIIWQMT